MLTDGRTDGRTDRRTDDGRKVITIAHPEQSSGELKTPTFFTKILSPWPCSQGHPRGGNGADKNFRPISTNMPYMNEIHQRVFKIWGLINFNAKTLTLWRKDERTYVRTNERTYVRTNGRTDERKSENYIPPYTSYVGGIMIHIVDSEGPDQTTHPSSLIWSFTQRHIFA